MAGTEWQRAFAEVPRAQFIPEVIWVEDDEADGYVVMSRSDDPDRWLASVEADEPVVTQVDDGRPRSDRVGRVGRVGRSPSSSCSQPSIVARMLEALEVHEGHAVLEIGTGTGWNAALLQARVGARGRVVSVEIDAGLAELARVALARAGRPVSVITGDGTAGYAPGAPYDRLIATAAVCRAVPHSWVAQIRPGGVIVTPWGTVYHNGALLRLRVTGDGAAVGRFDGNLAFMRLRTQRGPEWVDDENLTGAASSVSTLSSREIGQAVTDFDGGFAVGIQVPGCRLHIQEDTTPGTHLVWLSDGESLARVEVNVGRGRHAVRQRGPRRLWDEVEIAYTWWRMAGEPDHTRFGVAITPDSQRLWLDDPGNTVPTG